MPKFENFLETEDARNVKNHRIFERFLKKAVGADATIIVAHHITYMLPGEIPVEIPAADSLLFCQELMVAVFGKNAQNYMLMLAARKPAERDQMLNSFMDTLDIQERMEEPA